jgi:cell division protein FtsI (penicillin-binding protein 3)
MPDIKPGDRSQTKITLNELGISAHSAGSRGSQLVRATPKQHSVALHPVNIEDKVVPDTRGMGLRDALFLLENAGLTVRSSGYGSVRSQSLNPGTRIKPGMNITLTLSSEP